MLYYPMRFGKLERNLPLCPVTDSLYIAGFVLLGDPELTAECASQLLAIAPEYDYILSAESKGIPLAHEMAKQAGDRQYFVARKSEKAYMTGVFEVSVRSITTAREQKLCIDVRDAALMKGKRILLVDDVISTGASLRGMETLVGQAGGDIVGRMAVLAEGDAAKRKDILFLQPLPLFYPDGRVRE